MRARPWLGAGLLLYYGCKLATLSIRNNQMVNKYQTKTTKSFSLLIIKVTCI